MKRVALPILMEIYLKECFYIHGFGKNETVGIYSEKVKKWINRFSNDIDTLYKNNLK
jgi:hypothetical protein